MPIKRVFVCSNTPWKVKPLSTAKDSTTSTFRTIAIMRTQQRKPQPTMCAAIFQKRCKRKSQSKSATGKSALRSTNNPSQKPKPQSKTCLTLLDGSADEHK